MMFTLFAIAFSQLYYQPKTQLVYGLEAIGSIAGSLLFTFFCLKYFSIFQTLVLIATANLSIAVFMQVAFQKSKTGMHLIIIFLMVWVIINLFFDFDRLSKSLIYGKQQIILNRETPYGNLLVTQTAEQYNFYENGINLFSTDNITTNEEAIHYALVQCENPENVLIVSGDIAGLWRQLEKYPIKKADYVEINPAIIPAIYQITGFQPQGNLTAFSGDARHFIKHTKSSYNAVLLNIPAPGTAGLNRFYTVEFYQEVKKILFPDGVLSFPLEGGSNYLGGASGQVYAIVVSTLKSVFKNVMIIPGQTNYLLASDGPLTPQITARLQQKGIENEYVNFYYIDDLQIEQRGKEMMNRIKITGQMNRDFNPVAYFATINYWLSWYGHKIWSVVLPLVLLFLFIPFILKRYTFGMYVAGFTATSLEVLVLLVFQVLFGNFYQSIALLIAAFMAGLAIGSFLPGWLKISVTRRNFTLNQALIGISALALPGVILLQEKIELHQGFIIVLLYLIMVFSGVITAVHFAFAAGLQKSGISQTASKTYGADLLGSAGGAILISVFVIPLIGLMQTGFLLAGVNLVVAGLFLGEIKKV
jgi:spermidine synthase